MVPTDDAFPLLLQKHLGYSSLQNSNRGTLSGRHELPQAGSSQHSGVPSSRELRIYFETQAPPLWGVKFLDVTKLGPADCALEAEFRF